MSFDLAIWRTNGRYLTAGEAARIYSDLCSRPLESFTPGTEMENFVRTAADRHRSSGGSSDTPWAAQPSMTQDSAIMTIQSPLAGAMFPVIRQLARERGLVLFDPQSSKIYLPGPANSPDNTYTLELSDNRVIFGPDRALVSKCVNALSGAHWFMILERSSGAYLQVGVGERAGVPRDRYALEYLDDHSGRHWRAVLPASEDIAGAFYEYLDGSMAWTDRYPFRPLSEN
jgi:hypothetical protein